MNARTSILEKRGQLITLTVLIIICIISFLPAKSLISPPVASDDWSLIVAPYAFGELKPVNLSNHRPIDMSFYYVLSSIFGLKFGYYYLLNALILFLSAAMVYALVKRTFPQNTWLASLVSIIYLLYPVDYTRTWIMMLYIRFWWLISLVTIWLLLDFSESGNKWKLTLALFGIIIPLGAYEGQFGVVAAATFLIAVTSKTKSTFRKMALIGSIIIIGILFYLWRFHIQANITEIRYYSAGSFQFNPLVILERYSQGFKLFFNGWLDPVKAQLGASGLQLFIWMLGYITICFFVTFFIFGKNNSSTKLTFQQKSSWLKTPSMLLLMGGVFWVAGYFPIIGLYSPSLIGHASRVNSFAIAGAALMLGALVAMLSTVLARTTSQIHPLTIAIISPFILAGLFVQQHVNLENQAVWETQKNIWNGTLETIPNILDEKNLVIIVPSDEQTDSLSAYPFSTAWEVDAGAKVLYNNPKIGGYYYYYYKGSPDSQFEFTKNGIIPQGTERLIGYKRLIFVLYHPQENSVELVENVETTLSLPFSVNNYSPHENIIPAQPATTNFRWLVQ